MRVPLKKIHYFVLIYLLVVPDPSVVSVGKQKESYLRNVVNYFSQNYITKLSYLKYVTHTHTHTNTHTHTHTHTHTIFFLQQYLTAENLTATELQQGHL